MERRHQVGDRRRVGLDDATTGDVVERQRDLPEPSAFDERTRARPLDQDEHRHRVPREDDLLHHDLLFPEPENAREALRADVRTKLSVRADHVDVRDDLARHIERASVGRRAPGHARQHAAEP